MRVKVFGHYWHLPLVMLWLTDSALMICAYFLVINFLNLPRESPRIHWTQVLALTACTILAMIAMGMWSRRLRDRLGLVPLRLGMSVVIGGLLTAALMWPFRDTQFSLLQLATTMGAIWASVLMLRVSVRDALHSDRFKSRILIYGAGSNAARVLQLRRRSDRRGFKVAGFVRSGNETIAVPANRVFDASGGLCAAATDFGIDEIVIAMDDRRQHFPVEQLLECRLAGINVTELVTFMERETGKVYLDILNPSWMIFSGGFRRDSLRRHSERIFDLLASLGLLAFAAPVMILTALAIKLEDGLYAPIFYGQPRVGYGGKPFPVLKFRSMRVDAEADGKARWASANDCRITRVGRFIRKTRIDELPQLLNVLQGQMSFVGPRPERPEFVEQLAKNIPYYRGRHSVKPGITGWAQLCYAYGASEQDAVEKLQYDLYYVKNHGLFFDILILLQTIEVILFGKGAR